LDLGEITTEAHMLIAENAWEIGTIILADKDRSIDLDLSLEEAKGLRDTLIKAIAAFESLDHFVEALEPSTNTP
jgi:hypothetical protein